MGTQHCSCRLTQDWSACSTKMLVMTKFICTSRPSSPTICIFFSPACLLFIIREVIRAIIHRKWMREDYKGFFLLYSFHLFHLIPVVLQASLNCLEVQLMMKILPVVTCMWSCIHTSVLFKGRTLIQICIYTQKEIWPAFLLFGNNILFFNPFNI